VSRRVVAAGGDGTVRSVAFRLLGCEVALGILPHGTAMNVSRSLGIPLDLETAPRRCWPAGMSAESILAKRAGRPS
jgi:diacylglycerol kinase family enzyme